MENDKYFDEYMKGYILMKKINSDSFKKLSKKIDEIIFLNIKDEEIIRDIYTELIDCNSYIDPKLLRETFYRLSYYCRPFNQELVNEFEDMFEDFVFEFNYDGIYFDRVIGDAVNFYEYSGYSIKWIKSKINLILENRKVPIC